MEPVMPKPKIMFYHDGRHPLIYMYEPPMHKQEYEAAVDELVGTPVEAIMFCLGDGRTVLHDTKVGELWGHNVKAWTHEVFQRAHRNAKHLIEEGNDPLRIVCNRAHAKGLLLYPTLLVQQGRGPRDQDTRCSDFRFDHPQLEIGAAGDLPKNFAGTTCLDFKHEQVREERFALIEETLNNYPVDGFELQLNYCPYYFHPDQVEAGCLVMTDWITRVYEAVKKSGSDRELAIRIPASLDGCRSVGLDVKAWINQGIVDALVGQTFSGPELVDQTIDFRPLVEAAARSPTRVHAAVHSHVDSDRLGEATIEMVRASTCNYWAQGVDGLYLAHWFNNWPYDSSFYEKLRELPHPDVMASRDKYYYVPTCTGRYPEPPLEPGTTMQLPAKLKVNQPANIGFNISDDLDHWQEVEQVHEVLLRIRIMNMTELDRVEFRLNGQELADCQGRKVNQLFMMRGPRYLVWGYWFIYHLDSPGWPRQGRNTLQVTLRKRDSELATTIPIIVRDVEMEIKYLMGKNFHRGHDVADLGPHEHSVS